MRGRGVWKCSPRTTPATDVEWYCSRQAVTSPRAANSSAWNTFTNRPRASATTRGRISKQPGMEVSTKSKAR